MAEKMLKLIHINGRPAGTFLLHKTWGIGTKISHFNEIQKLTGVDYKDMVFFDDEARNRDVEQRLGVTFVLVQEETGVNWDVFNRGLELWRKKNNLEK
ncbi:acid phosphatase (predicted) [Sugiyamaella lignohabitans]|uniref:Acid phosphatase (Predicted) n=1 Tax=Sugiyamaella lignohabitans TaxID=796027 RepID=A0A167FEE1_9ASCO|nr:acid phosphatase (predicted) [Sugiyamaella lignohabitans]ANB15194.1 acid phosphatase (predicted) [Sugiyamaella lignohabitans]